MTLAELHERIGWQLDGRLQTRYENNWVDVKHTAPPHVCDPPEVYRRRPDPAPMPDEVWVADCAFLREAGKTWTSATCYPVKETCILSNESGVPVRYVRAGAVIPASQLQYRDSRGEYEWENEIPANVVYRIKP